MKMARLPVHFESGYYRGGTGGRGERSERRGARGERGEKTEATRWKEVPPRVLSLNGHEYLRLPRRLSKEASRFGCGS